MARRSTSLGLLIVIFVLCLFCVCFVFLSSLHETEHLGLPRKKSTFCLFAECLPCFVLSLLSAPLFAYYLSLFGFLIFCLFSFLAFFLCLFLCLSLFASLCSFILLFFLLSLSCGLLSCLLAQS